MGQFDSYIQRTLNPPPVVDRLVCLVVPIGFVVRAVHRPTLENVLTAIVFGVLMFPSGVAPAAYPARLSALERTNPLLGYLFMFLLMGCGIFMILRWFLDRTPSAVIAVVLAPILVLVSHFLRRRRLQ